MIHDLPLDILVDLFMYINEDISSNSHRRDGTVHGSILAYTMLRPIITRAAGLHVEASCSDNKFSYIRQSIWLSHAVMYWFMPHERKIRRMRCCGSPCLHAR